MINDHHDLIVVTLLLFCSHSRSSDDRDPWIFSRSRLPKLVSKRKLALSLSSTATPRKPPIVGPSAIAPKTLSPGERSPERLLRLIVKILIRLFWFQKEFDLR